LLVVDFASIDLELLIVLVKQTTNFHFVNFFLLLRHFTIRGADGTDFEGGVYHGRIMVRMNIEVLLVRFPSYFFYSSQPHFISSSHVPQQLPPEYPFKPPHIIFLTPSGRFETNTKVCLSFSAYHRKFREQFIVISIFSLFLTCYQRLSPLHAFMNS